MPEKKELYEGNKNPVFEKLKKEGYLDKYPNLIVKKTKDGIYSVQVDKASIWYFSKENGETILNIENIAKLPDFVNYCQKLGIKEEKDDQGIYHIYTIDNKGKKKEIDKYSEEYFNIRVDISFLHGRDFVLKVFEGNTKKTVLKIENKLLEMMIKDKVIRFIDLLLLKQYGNITKEQLIKYNKEVQGLLLEQIGDNRFSMLADRNINIDRKGKQYQINASYVGKEEIQYYYDSHLISEYMYNLAMEKLEELQRLEEKEQSEIQKQLGEDKKAIRDL